MTLDAAHKIDARRRGARRGLRDQVLRGRRAQRRDRPRGPGARRPGPHRRDAARAHARCMARGGRIYDGPDEVHRQVVARRILKAFAKRRRVAIPVDVETLQGQLLVSSPSLHDPNFRKTVVLDRPPRRGRGDGPRPEQAVRRRGSRGGALARRAPRRGRPRLRRRPRAARGVHGARRVRRRRRGRRADLRPRRLHACRRRARRACDQPHAPLRRLRRLGRRPARGGARGAGVDRRRRPSPTTPSPTTRTSSGERSSCARAARSS